MDDIIKLIRIDEQNINPIYRQIEDSIIEGIKEKWINLGDRVPSINKVCRHFSLAPGTVTRAYDELQQRGILVSKQGKGYYINGTNIEQKIQVFMLFDRLNAYKEILYNSFIAKMGEQAHIQLFFHHYDSKRFKELIRDHLGKFHYYVIMPHFNENVEEHVNPIPPEKLLLIDKGIPGLKGKYNSVYQDFYIDIKNGLTSVNHLIHKYRRINLVLSSNKFQFIPDGIREGVQDYCRLNDLGYRELDLLKPAQVHAGEMFIVFTDQDLIYLIREKQRKGFQTGEDIGIISYDDTPMKEILDGGITVATTDFVKMGKTCAKLILSGETKKIHNPFRIIVRKSL